MLCIGGSILKIALEGDGCKCCDRASRLGLLDDAEIVHAARRKISKLACGGRGFCRLESRLDSDTVDVTREIAIVGSGIRSRSLADGDTDSDLPLNEDFLK